MSSPRAITAQRARDAAKGKEVSIGKGRTAKVGTIAEQKHVGKCPKRGERRYTRDGSCKPLSSTKPPCPPYSEAVGGRCMAIVHSQTPAARAARGEKRSPRSVADDSSSSSDSAPHMSRSLRRFAQLVKGGLIEEDAWKKVRSERRARRTKIVEMKIRADDEVDDEPQEYKVGDLLVDEPNGLVMRVSSISGDEINVAYADDVKYVFRPGMLKQKDLAKLREQKAKAQTEQREAFAKQQKLADDASAADVADSEAKLEEARQRRAKLQESRAAAAGGSGAYTMAPARRGGWRAGASDDALYYPGAPQ